MKHAEDQIRLPALRSSAVPVFSPALQHGFRLQLLSIMNAAIAEQSQDSETAMKLVMGEVALGIDFVFFKKGLDGLQAYAQSEDGLARLVSIARAVKREWIQCRKDAVEERLKLPSSLSDTYRMSGLFIPLSSTVLNPERLEVEKRGLILTQHFGLLDIGELYRSSGFRSFSDLQDFARGLDQMIAILTLLDDLKLTMPEIATELLDPDSPARRLLYQMEHEVGILDLAVFCAVFRHRHGVAKPSALTLDYHGAKLFSSEIVPEKGSKAYPVLTYHDGVLEAYRDACDEVFPTHGQEAFLVLEYYLRKILQCHQSRRRNGMPFPSQRPLKTRAGKKGRSGKERQSEDEIDEKIRDDDAASRHVHEKVHTLLAMKPKEFKKYVTAFPDAHSWRSCLEEEEPTLLTDLLQRFVDAEASALAARFLLLLVWYDLDFDDQCGYPVFRFLTDTSQLDLGKFTPGIRVIGVYERLSMKTRGMLTRELHKLRSKKIRDIVY